MSGQVAAWSLHLHTALACLLTPARRSRRGPIPINPNLFCHNHRHDDEQRGLLSSYLVEQPNNSSISRRHHDGTVGHTTSSHTHSLSLDHIACLKKFSQLLPLGSIVFSKPHDTPFVFSGRMGIGGWTLIGLHTRVCILAEEGTVALGRCREGCGMPCPATGHS